jgi:maltose alpha-D-glucosyltransferase/alpha-amylase
VNFLRSHDELDLGRLSDAQRQEVFDAMAPDPDMQLYNRGIRRRLAPMLGNDRRRLELAFSLLYSLPGTPMMQYGDEIGIGDNLEMDERECARTPMQWTAERHGGFSRAEKCVRPVNEDDEYGYQKVNVNAMRRDPRSLLNWTSHVIRTRRECPEFCWGSYVILPTSVPEVLAIRYDWRNTQMATLHNFGKRARRVEVDLQSPRGHTLCDVLDNDHSRAGSSGRHSITLPAYGYRWYRLGSADNTLERSALGT